jgi:hypothetical protein
MSPGRDLLRWPVITGLVAVVAVFFIGAAVVYPRLTGDDAPAAGPTTSAASGVPTTATSPSTSDAGGAGTVSGTPGSPAAGTGATASRPDPPEATLSGPRIVSFAVTQQVRCPTTASGAVTPLILSWHAAGGVTRIALSVDNPGIVGSYQTYDGPDGSETFTNFGCRGPAGSRETHVFTIYTVGGGKQVSRTLTISAVVDDLDADTGTTPAASTSPGSPSP